MTTIRVNPETCTRCQICVRECPSVIIRMDQETGLPVLENPSPAGVCIACSHCAILCPTGALRLDFLPDAARCQADLSRLPGADQYETLMATRRSVRQFRPAGLPRSAIDQILALANLAPTATNSQKVHWVITAPETTRELRDRCTAHLEARLHRNPDDGFASRYLYRIRLGSDTILRTAPHVAIALVPQAYIWKDDGIIALTHFDNACHALGYGSCWGGLLRNLLVESADLRAFLGIGDELAICNTMLFGERQLKPTAQLPLREPIKVRYV